MSAASNGSADPGAEWSTRYADYLKSSTERAARTAELNQRLVTRVARGELMPVTLDSQFTRFVAENAPGYASELAKLSMQFFAGLIASGSAYSHELVEKVVPGELPAPDRRRPEFDPDEWASWFQQLTDYAAEENAALVRTLRTVMDRVASGDLDPQRMQAVSEEYHGERSSGAVADIVALYFDLISRLDEAHSSFGNRYLEDVLDLARDSERSDATLDLTGPIGGTASVRFAVSNDGAGATSLRGVMTDVRRADGIGPAFEPDVTVSPERFVLEPGAEEILALTIRLSPGRFEPGPEYVGTLHVLSPGSTLVEVPLRIRATARPDPPAAGSDPAGADPAANAGETAGA